MQSETGRVTIMRRQERNVKINAQQSGESGAAAMKNMIKRKQ